MGVSRYVNMAFAVIGLITWIIAAKFVGFVLDLLNPNWNRMLIGENFTVSTLSGLIIALVTVIVLKSNDKINVLGTEIANELKKVTWPTWKETKVSTVVVIITTIIISLILGFFDFVWLKVTGTIYSF